MGQKSCVSCDATGKISKDKYKEWTRKLGCFYSIEDNSSELVCPFCLGFKYIITED